MSGFYKAEAVHEAAVKLGYEGEWDGTLSSAIKGLLTAIGEEPGSHTTDAEALAELGEAVYATIEGEPSNGQSGNEE